MFKAEQLDLFEIEPEDARAIYGTSGIPFLVAVTSPVSLTANMRENVTAGTHPNPLAPPLYSPS